MQIFGYLLLVILAVVVIIKFVAMLEPIYGAKITQEEYLSLLDNSEWKQSTVIMTELKVRQKGYVSIPRLLENLNRLVESNLAEKEVRIQLFLGKKLYLAWYRKLPAKQP